MTAAPAPGSSVLVTAAADELVGRLSDLAAALRERGARLGLRELLTAVRCVDAVDCTSREDARLALRAAMCSRRSDLERFDEAFTEVFGAGWEPRPADIPLSELGSIEKAALPRAAFGDPQTASARRRRRGAGAGRLVASSSCCSRRTSRATPRPRWRWRRS